MGRREPETGRKPSLAANFRRSAAEVDDQSDMSGRIGPLGNVA